MHNFGRGMWRRISDYQKQQEQPIQQQPISRLDQYLQYLQMQKQRAIDAYRANILKKESDTVVTESDLKSESDVIANTESESVIESVIEPVIESVAVIKEDAVTNDDFIIVENENVVTNDVVIELVSETIISEPISETIVSEEFVFSEPIISEPISEPIISETTVASEPTSSKKKRKKNKG